MWLAALPLQREQSIVLMDGQKFYGHLELVRIQLIVIPLLDWTSELLMLEICFGFFAEIDQELKRKTLWNMLYMHTMPPPRQIAKGVVLGD